MILKRIKNKLKYSTHSYLDRYKPSQELLQDNKYYHSQKIKEIFKEVGHIPKKGTDEYYDYMYHLNSMKNIEDILEKRENYSKFELFDLADKIKSFENTTKQNIDEEYVIPSFDTSPQQNTDDIPNKKYGREQFYSDLFNLKKRYANLLA